MRKHVPIALAFVLVAASISPSAAQEEVAELELLIGTWKCKTQNAEVESSFRWILDRHFIEHEHTLRLFGQSHRVKEIIGWDAKSKSVKGWIFTTNGIAASSYQRDGDAWKIEVTLTRNDGSESTKKKRLVVNGGKLSITNEAAPLPEFLKLDFKRQPNDKPQNINIVGDGSLQVPP